MVIYIFTKAELNKTNTSNIITTVPCKCETIEINNCITTTNTKTPNSLKETTTKNSKININSASIEELTSLSGIGESKAEAIIKYRNEHGSFLTIEDIKNVTGLGDNIFDKIKDNITV